MTSKAPAPTKILIEIPTKPPTITFRWNSWTASRMIARCLWTCLIPLTMAVTLTGCGLVGKHQPQVGVVDPNQPKELQMVSLPDYVIEPPDELEISVRPSSMEVPLTTASVQMDGKVDLGYAGDVYLAGLTLAEAEAKVAQQLEEVASRKRIREPLTVSVRLVNGSQSKYYYVLGSVTTQGRFPIQGNEDVLSALTAAGIRSNSQPEKAYVVRPHPPGGHDQLLRIDWQGITEAGDTMTNYQLFPGDRIIVPGGRKPGLLGSLFGG